MKRKILLLLAVSCIAYYPSRSDVAEMASSARDFLASLGSEQQAHATFSFQDDERLNWHYIPKARKGVSFEDLAPAQRKMAHVLMASGLSREGYRKANQIIYLEQILYELEDQNPVRDPEDYFFSVFAKPSTTSTWGWRLEGHHLTVNFTIDKGQVISATPFFFGANPAHVLEGPHKGLRVLAAEEDRARELFLSLKKSHGEKVLIDVEAPAEIITGADRQAKMDLPVGILLSEMKKEQAAHLIDLISLYANRLRPELADVEWKRLRQEGIEKIHFAWAGASERAQPHYYRIQGPTFVIEYDNTQNNANHIHSVWRNFTNDFGLDVLRRHYVQNHPGVNLSTASPSRTL